MCGITGFIDFTQQNAAKSLAVIRQMTNTLHHRGPDDQGVWQDEANGLAFGQTRLSILDLTQHGHQPMASSCGRYVIVFNGEIYNHLEIRRQLNRPFTGHSDTQTLIEALAEWGIDQTLSQLNGMFAFALWDRENKELTLARDRIGVKPLYWGNNPNGFYFASELKALHPLPMFDKTVNPTAIYEFLHYAYIPTPLSIYKNTFKLKPGHYLQLRPGQEPSIACYWNLEEKAIWGMHNSLSEEHPEEAIEELEALLKDAISQRFISDVPLGAFLSGGVDSSLVVAMMQELSKEKVKTFTIGFQDKSYDESAHAKQVAQHLGTDHTELILTPQQVLDVIPKIPQIYDEPFADSSQIPTYLVSQLARKSVTVALSGDGGDESFAGYNRYLFAQSSSYRLIKALPSPLRKTFGNLLSTPSPQTWDKLSLLIPASKRPRQLGDKLAKLSACMKQETDLDIYHTLISCFHHPERLLKKPLMPNIRDIHPEMDFLSHMQLHDILGYLPDDIMTKVDRASMANSLEAREPLLDYRVVEYAWRLPQSFKIRNKTSKWILREILYKRVPKQLIERPKMGFGLPIDQWLRGPLKEWLNDLLTPANTKDFFDTAAIQNILNLHMKGTQNLQHQLWALAIFQQWRLDHS